MRAPIANDGRGPLALTLKRAVNCCIAGAICFAITFWPADTDLGRANRLLALVLEGF
jgi:hypothetical protein